MSKAKQAIIKYLFALAIIVPIVLNYTGFIQFFYELLIFGIVSGVASVLILFKKYYFLANLISSKGEAYIAFELKLGRYSGYACVGISVICFVLAFINR
ncbi:hypothetical protein [Enterococcus sp.]|uniref:hypothetical protein n=1 Tax=Enterococcus sp. TaxID=35783 RepID=UPI002912FE21|nr:hypothetical protein [Enterococcus sp.]MDU5332873.1 hypothetical protein [Enterococcus sp.]